MKGIIKTVSAISLIVGGGYLGYTGALFYKIRLTQLNQFREGLVQLKFNISFLKMPIASALSGAGECRKGVVCKIIKETSKNISEKNMIPKTAWKEAIENNNVGLCISDEDKIILSEFFDNLGKGDVESECRNIDAAYAKLTSAGEDAKGEAERMYKLFKGLGLLGGMLAAVILL